jgi:pyruvate dehydrogenase E2 component (dihydrolipoamide acetyltransferase)
MARVPIRMPKMSMTMTEGELSSWSVQPGATLSAGDVVCEVLTDKVDMEVETPAAGTLVEIVVESGTVPVGDTIGWIEAEGDSFTDLLDFGAPDGAAGASEPAAEGDDLQADVPAESPPPDVTGGAEPGRVTSGPVPAVPRARLLAREHGVDLRSLTPTGPGGVVSVDDVRRAVPGDGRPDGRPTEPASTVTVAPAPVAAAPVAVPPVAPARRGAPADRAAGIRRAVARRMTESAGVPQFTVWRDLHLDAAETHRDGLSWTTVLLQSYARALRALPRLLTRWDGTTVVDAGPPCVALAVDTDHGLLVPVFREPDTANPRRLDEELRGTVAAARSGRVDPAHLIPANASLSNLGGLGADRFQALVTPPQASVLALGAISRRPVAVPGGVGTALVLTAGLTVDHRVADGADGARLLALMADDLG